jgi:hypothetical protein
VATQRELRAWAVFTESQARRLCLRVRCANTMLRMDFRSGTRNTTLCRLSATLQVQQLCDEVMTSRGSFLICALKPLVQAVHAWSVLQVQTCPRCPDTATRIETPSMDVFVHDGVFYKYAAMVLRSWFYLIRTTQQPKQEAESSLFHLLYPLILSHF